MNKDIRKIIRQVKFDRTKLGKYADSVGAGKGAVEKDFLISTFFVLLAYDKAFTPFLKKVVFRGGTCIKKVYYPKEARFSEDLDLTSLTGQEMNAFLTLLNSLSRIDLGVTQITQAAKLYENPTGLDIRLDYTSVLGQPNHIMFNLSATQTMRNPRESKVEVGQYYPSLEPMVQAMDIREVLVEKTRALLQRTRPRDVFDVWFLARQKGLPIDRQMLERKLIRSYQAAPESSRESASFYSSSKIIQIMNAVTDAVWRQELGGQLVRDSPSRKVVISQVSEIVTTIGDFDLREK